MSRFTVLRRCTAAFVVVCMALFTLAPAHAVTIDFGGLPQSNGSTFYGPYAEDGYSVIRTGGDVFEGHVFGQPTPSLVVGPVFNGSANGSISVTFGGGQFKLDAFDLIGNNGGANYVVTGLFGASTVFTLNGSVGGVFTTVSGNAGVIDSLSFSLTATGTSLNLDNLVVRNVTAVPLPAALLLFASGLGGLLGYGWRKQKPAVS